MVDVPDVDVKMQARDGSEHITKIIIYGKKRRFFSFVAIKSKPD